MQTSHVNSGDWSLYTPLGHDKLQNEFMKQTLGGRDHPNPLRRTNTPPSRKKIEEINDAYTFYMYKLKDAENKDAFGALAKKPLLRKLGSNASIYSNPAISESQ